MNIVLAIFGSAGLWAAVVEIIKLIATRKKKPKPIGELVLGLAYMGICTAGREYIEAGEIGFEERENFRKYLFTPYKAAGGNGTAEAIMKQVDALPIKDTEGEYHED